MTLPEKQRRRSRGTVCKQTWSERRGTLFLGLRKPMELVMIVVTRLCSGCPVPAIVQAFQRDERTVADGRDRAGQHSQQIHEALVEQEQLDVMHVQADEIRVKGRKMVAWMGLCAVSASTKFLRNAGEGERNASRTPNPSGVETPRGKEPVGKAEHSRRSGGDCSARPVCMGRLVNGQTLGPVG